MSSVALSTLGCKLNFSETSSISNNLEKNNFKVVPFNQYADAYIINTCSVTENADNKFKVFVNKALKINPNAFVAAIGCYAQLKPKELLSVKGVDLVLGASEKFNIVNYLQNIDQDFTKLDHSCNINDVDSFTETYSTNSRTRAFLKVQDGCDYKCSFCTIPLARGKSRSNSIENVVKNVKEIISNGIKEIVLTGINLGDFGKRQSDSFKTNEDFLELIKTLDKIDGVERYRVSSIEPNLLTDEIISFISMSKRFVPHFHIPLQSGSDQILKKMRRRYKTDLYQSRVELIRKLMPAASIGVDVIVGFPGETDEMFLETYDFIKKLDITYLHVFSYSERENTKAIELNGVVPKKTRNKRSKLLRLLSASKKTSFYKKNIGTDNNVLFESENKNGLIEGYTENYIRVRKDWNKNLVGKIRKVRIEKVDSEGYAVA
ncbi:MAG TPA: tRNA (N(6)-L-threonylcarbamoyladenosine(37)-C(2))-methylthiotransferase MtaB [Flavobacteriaceae bacterium]|nr:tRNA (N(6)-L-threonylcarbamoyladenosine(37)-C(2))-methylthiotransferase MtaB [Flavobacteriaceae bacterium]